MIRACSDDLTALRSAFSGFPCGVAAVAAEVDGEQHVLIASSFTVGVSQDPPMVMFAVQKSSSTWPLLGRADAIGVSVLGVTHAEQARQLAAKDKKRRFEGVRYAMTEAGAVLLEDAPIWMECSVEHLYPAGDHDIVVLRVHAFHSDFEHSPLVWHRSAFTQLAS
ncbi:flavin reductase family protein [Nocardioides carbamazepini]|uniref:flavin reductase family protein n=1 Tax=Nocardioides carbamazepini TaxID=2854259 RepID=UPI002149E53E|nr:flavin reductase family protein [Nocardioides carbamazepini]MCR1785850.1 flavin reductase family protein [Nocardioides carbamazepini]